ncbi:endonuclease/exonuclease/phosphatase family protein [Streptomyces sp. NPDC057638]|uniref:endonuclease/exonuclease/phosphatase family protein n=1 Tax=Streptomyces sp. NPDC057638 TaxID=3346190 RepID=UPI0036C85542
MGRIRALVPALATVLGLMAGVAPAGTASAATATVQTPAATAPAPAGTAAYKVWHWNVSGHEVDRGATTNGLVDAVLASVQQQNPDFISLNEICPNQYTAVLKGLQKAGWPNQDAMTNFARFEPVPEANADLCGDDPTGQPDADPYGVALFSRFKPSGTDRITLPFDGEKERKLLCVPIAQLTGGPNGLRFCTTHITYHFAHEQAQLDVVRSRMEQWTLDGGTVITAGDFNVQPHEDKLNGWYAPSADTTHNGGNSGMFRELDDLDPVCPGWGEQTTEGGLGGLCGQRGKVDLIFAAESRLASYDADAHPIGPDRCKNGSQQLVRCSNHRITTATATVHTP